LPSQLLEIIVPSYSAWFSLSSIHDIERRGLPEFFNNRNKSKSPETYIEYRNFMVNTYRLNPGEYLTVTACRRNLTGDVCSIIRVHAFLEQWGLINYQVCIGDKPTFIGPDFKNHFRITAVAVKPPSSAHGPLTREVLQPHQVNIEVPSKVPEAGALIPKPADKIIPQKRSAEDDTSSSVSALPSTSTYRATSSTSLSYPPPAKRVKRTCHTCLADCTAFFYHSVRNPSLNVCAACFSDGRFPGAMISSEFVKIDNFANEQRLHSSAAYHAYLDDDVPWSEAELYLLLEGVEVYDEDWSRISEHVGTRSKDQCFVCFLQLPVEERHVPGGLMGLLEIWSILIAEETGDAGLKMRASTMPLKLRGTVFSEGVDPGLGIAALMVALVKPEMGGLQRRLLYRLWRR
ncbi:SWIRM domain-containing protein, partial [Chytridium lagenaria]